MIMEEWERPFSNMKVNWFPGHMAKAQKLMRNRLKQVDVVFEVRDARIPLSSANPELDSLIGNKARLVVLNKEDLSDPQQKRAVREYLRNEGKEVLFTNCSDTSNNSEGTRALLKWAREKGAIGGKFATLGSMAMVVGMPNVGKSSLINHMRRLCRQGAAGSSRKVARVGIKPGVTRGLDSFRVAEPPNALYMIDTPGVMIPRIQSAAIGLRLALTAAVPDSIVGEEVLVGYLCSLLNERGEIVPAVRELGLAEHTNSLRVEEMLYAAEKKCGATGKLEHQCREMASRYVLRLFRSGRLGRVSLDLADKLAV